MGLFDFFDDFIKGTVNAVSDPVGESQRFLDEKVDNLGDLARGGGEVASDLSTSLLGGLFGQGGIKATQEGGLIGGGASIFGGLQGAAIGGFAKSLGLDPKILIIGAVVVGIIVLLMVLK